MIIREWLNNIFLFFSEYDWLIGLFEFLIAMWTLLKVQSVNKAQKEARQFTQDLLNIDRLEVDLVRVINKFRSLNEIDSSLLASELSLQLGMIKGVRRALDESSNDSSRSRKIIQSENGFFSEEFVRENIQKANSHIDIITGRTKLASGFYILDCLRQACERGVKIRIIGLSPDSPDDILNDAIKTVSNPAPKNAADYKRQIIETKREICESVLSWSKEAQENIMYKVSKSVPRVSILRSDNIINFGFLQFYRDAQTAEIADREYLKIPISSSTGKIACRHIDLVCDEADYVLPIQNLSTENNNIE